MKFVAEIDVMPLEALLDPQGKAVHHSLPAIGVEGVADVRIGKHITLTLNATSEDEARKQVEISCQKMLANPIMEKYSYKLHSHS